MPRPKTPEGKTVTVCVKVSDTDSALIDARCAQRGLTRSAWLQGLIAADLGTTAAPRASMRRPASPDCDHPKGRRLKGLCNACGTYVG